MLGCRDRRRRPACWRSTSSCRGAGARPGPPPFLITRNAVLNLKTTEALDSWEEITPLGLHLLDIPLDPWLGKILQHAVMHKCLDPVLIITYSSSLLLSMDPASRREGSKKKEGC